MVPIKEFKESEFKCRCGHEDCDYGYADMDEKFLSALFTARKKSIVGYTLSSAVRCPRHPDAIKNPTSSHNANRAFGKKCKAVDISAPNSAATFEIVTSLLAGGIRRLGWNQSLKFIHADLDLHKPQRLLFSY